MEAQSATASTPHHIDQTAIGDYLIWAHRHNHRPETLKLRSRVLPLISRNLPNGLVEASEADLAVWDVGCATLKPWTRRTYLTALHSFYDYATGHGLVTDDPASRLVAPRAPRRLPRPLPPVPTMDAIGSLPAGAGRLALELMVGAGLRSCEVARLRRTEIFAGSDGPMLEVCEGKGGHQRVIPIPEWLAVEVAASGGRTIVIPRPDGKEFSSEGVRSLARRAMRAAGIAGTPHQLRHTFLTELWTSTLDIRFVQDVAGHQDPRTTAGYTKWSAQGKRQAIDELLPRPAAGSHLKVVS